MAVLRYTLYGGGVMDEKAKEREEIQRGLERLIQAHRDYFEEYRDARFPPSEHALSLRRHSKDT